MEEDVCFVRDDDLMICRADLERIDRSASMLENEVLRCVHTSL
jgi:hypothetical protein